MVGPGVRVQLERKNNWKVNLVYTKMYKGYTSALVVAICLFLMGWKGRGAGSGNGKGKIDFTPDSFSARWAG